ncbi:MFS transporter [Sphingopyxis sp.]|uniref:MFS transporter n=1 Tax=Sphingopyxis sp. TaxID=1908224 RepID=UPI0025F91C11|nr:MFS transporter [Sphingopyxis sp.]
MTTAIPAPATAAAVYPAFRQARFSQFIIGLIGLFVAMDVTVVGLLVEPMKHDLGLSDVQVGLVHTTSFFAAYGLLAIPMGMLADRTKRVRLLSIAMCLSCASLLFVGLSHDLWLLAGAKALMGAALAMTYPAGMSLMADNFAPERRAFPSVTFGMGQDLGGGAGLLIGGLGYSALVAMVAVNADALAGIAPWRAVSLIFAGIGLLLIPAVMAMREPPRMEVKVAGNGSFRELWAYRTFLLPLFAGMFALGGLVSGLRVWFAPALMRLYDLEPGDFAVWMSIVMLIGGFSGHALSGKLMGLASAQRSDAAAVRLAALAAIICVPTTFLAMMPGTGGFGALACIFMIASGIALAIPVIVINLRIPNELRGLCMGMYVALISVSGMIGAPLIGYASQRLGGDAMLGGAIALVGAPFALIAAVSLWVASTNRSDRQPVQAGGGEPAVGVKAGV